jgi:hypothetical protein
MNKNFLLFYSFNYYFITSKVQTIMSSPNIRAARLSDSRTFIPKEQIPVHCRKSAIYIYPPIKEGMSDAEKLYAFMINKTAILTEDIHPKVKLRHSATLHLAFHLSTLCRRNSISHENKWIFKAGYYNVYTIGKTGL